MRDRCYLQHLVGERRGTIPEALPHPSPIMQVYFHHFETVDSLHWETYFGTICLQISLKAYLANFCLKIHVSPQFSLANFLLLKVPAKGRS